jgi:hypothetical protein
MTDEDKHLRDKAEILVRMGTSYRALRAAFDRAGPELLVRPGTWGEWSLKDLLAHLAYWQQHSTEILQRAAAGDIGESSATDDPSVDEVNQHIYQANRDRPLADMLEAFEVGHLAFRTAIKSLPPSVYVENERVRMEVGWDGYLHYDEHRADIERAIQQATT